MFSSNTSQVSSGGYEIQRSLRFNSADGASLDRTPGSATNRRTWTWSGWVKRSSLNTFQYFFNASPDSFNNTFSIASFGAGASEDQLRFTEFQGGAQVANIRTTQVFRDVSAWYHIVLVADTTQATDSNRFKMYVNGVQITSFALAAYPAQNADLTINNNVLTTIGYITTTNNFNGYMTEINFIDGQALTPSSFGAFDAQTGVWGPKAYAGSYGTNGFYLNFSDNSNTTAATLGRDYSGNSNNWTPNNFSVSAGAGNDSLVDVPTNWGVDTDVGGTVRGNYCTWNPLTSTSGITVPSNGNLDISDNFNTAPVTLGTIAMSSGKWYWEVQLNSLNCYVGVATPESRGSVSYLGAINGQFMYNPNLPASSFVNGSVYAYSTGSTAASGDIIGIALNFDTDVVTYYKNGVSMGTFSSGLLTGKTYLPAFKANDTASAFFNFGQRPFAYTAPSGFRALNTQNLPTPTIGATTATQAGKFFNTVLFQKSSFPATIDGVGFQPDLTWWKERSRAQPNFLMDTLRGPSSFLISNSTAAADTQTNMWVTNSDGWTSSSGALTLDWPYVAWNWRANGAGVTNTAGTITSTVSANTTSGFSVVTFTGINAGATVGHGLSAAPRMIIMKARNAADNWYVYHVSIGAPNYLILNGTAASAAAGSVWLNTTPTSSVFSIGNNTGTATQVAYCFAEVPGYSRFGSYTGNGSTDGPFVFCGFRPAWVLVKRSNGADDWHLFDNRRDGFNALNDPLYPNGTFAEGSGFTYMDLVSNGFKCRNNSFINVSGVPYIFVALAEAPQKFSLAR